MRFRDFMRLLWKNRFRVHPLRWPMALITSSVSLFNSAMAGLQFLFYERDIARTEVDPPPVFIIGHWRSGTTHLHELLIRDDRFAFPTTFECFAPYHFLITGKFLPQMLWFLMPPKRPMDNMAAGFDRPQEDEFALVGMGAPSMYFRMAFPGHAAPHMDTLDLDGISDEDCRRLKESLQWFLKAQSYLKKGRLVLKSPPHTGRVGMLAEMFPGAKFIHIVRNPYAIFPSMKHTWAAMDLVQGFQMPAHDKLNIDEFILSAFERMYRGFDRQRHQLDPSQLYEVRYEDLVLDPMGQVQAMYESLDLGDFEYMRPRLAKYVATQREYKPNRLQLEPEIEDAIRRRWAGYIERYGYE